MAGAEASQSNVLRGVLLIVAAVGIFAVMDTIGVLASVGHFLLIRAYDYANATGLAPFFYTQLVWVMLLGRQRLTMHRR